MADFFDYLVWRGDLTFEKDAFNAVDGAILAQFAYIPFEYLKTPLPDGFTSIQELCANALSDTDLSKDRRWKESDDRLLAEMAKSRRFGKLGVGFCSSRLDEKMQTQFFAVTIRLDDELFYISFRGTDNTLVGWKEDLNMSYLCPIPGQEMAAAYLKRISQKVNGRLMLGGHSKGGNLAVFAGAFCGKELQDRIFAIFNYDGPGFFDNILQTDDYDRICPKIHTYVPQFSVVGMLFERKEKYTIVHSTQSGFLQHNLYSWDILGKQFVHLKTVTNGSRFVDSTIKDWAKDMTPEQFESFAETIYKVLSETNAQTLREMKENRFDSMRRILHSIGGLDNQTRTAAFKVLQLLAHSAGKEAKETVEAIGALTR